MANAMNRRRFLAISAASAATSMAAPVLAATGARWRGIALGAPATMKLTGLSQQQARPVFQAVEAEIARLEQVFSLFREDSEVARLNRVGRVSMPSPDLLEVLSLCDRLHVATDGTFDPTIQPMWLALAQGQNLAAAQALTGWHNLQFDTSQVHLTRPGMAITLNGVAQGYITDRVAAVLRDRGLDNILIDVGEVAALGGRPDGQDWRAGIADPNGHLVHQITLRDRSLATSAPLGTVLDSSGTVGHILDPRPEQHVAKHLLVSVSADNAAVADGLSTALCLLEKSRATAAISAFAGARIEYLT